MTAPDYLDFYGHPGWFARFRTEEGTHTRPVLRWDHEDRPWRLGWVAADDATPGELSPATSWHNFDGYVPMTREQYRRHFNGGGQPRRPGPGGPPSLAAYRTGPGRRQLRIFCKWCNGWHAHGAPDLERGSGDGHRVAHCADDTPYAATGYVLREVGDPEHGLGPDTPARIADQLRDYAP